ncbi:hypothetical protein CMV37_03685 [Bacillus cereus]|nr:hypothetical protein CMV37_03685 [Bacillus cereus]
MSRFRFLLNRLRWLEGSAISLLPTRQRTPLCQEFQCPPLLDKPPTLFITTLTLLLHQRFP